ncbi:MAG: DUF3829 domain-containing protein [Pyrinomonadaceae bacterium]
MRRHLILTLIVTLAAMLAGTAGCQKLAGLKRASSTITPSENELLGQKLEQYIGCVNSFDTTAHRSYEEYARAMGKQGPGRGRTISSLGAANDHYFDQCFEKLQKGLDVLPAVDDLDQGAQSYLAAMQKLKPVLKEANDYYKQEDYKDDEFAKGRELHGPLVAAFDEFERSSEQMRAAVDKYDTLYKERSLAEIERAEGRKLRYLTRAMMVRAKEMLRAGDDKELTADKLQPALDAYSQSIDAAQAYFNEHKDEARNGGCWSSLESDAKSFLKEGKEKLRYLREHRKPPPPKRGIFSRDRFIDAYNSLIRSSNLCLNMI